MDQLMGLGYIVGSALVGLITIGLIFARLYRRSSKELAFVRTGLGGQKVVMDGGAVVLPIFHECVNINMNTLKLEVSRSGADSLITLDRLRVDAVAAFFVRVIPSVEGVASAAQTLGQRTMHPDSLKELVEDKFVDALRAAAVSMGMHQLLDKRGDFIQAVQNAVSEDLLKNGLELESVSLTRLDQTPIKFFDSQNAFDAEGLTKLTQQTQQRARERNEIEQDTAVAIAKKNYEATQLKLNIEKDQTFATLHQQQEVATRDVQQKAEIASITAQREREAQQAKIDAERLVQEAEVEKSRAIRQRQIEADREVQVAKIEQEKQTTLVEQDKQISIAEKSKAQSEAETLAHQARALAAGAEEQIKTARDVAIAERDKQIALVAADQDAQERAIGVRVAAEAEKDAAENQAEAIKIKAEAQQLQYQVEANGIEMRNAALNTLAAEQIAMQIKMKLLEVLPSIIEASVKPIEKIDSIKIVQVDGLNRGPASNAGETGSSGGGSLADQAVAAALTYRAQQPILDAVLNEVGLKGGDLNHLVQAATQDFSPAEKPTKADPANTQQANPGKKSS
ncbi:MAG: flotillin family protein [Methylomonas sp.]|jgi:uncharacterized membrane protein YqiK|uniref:flotillin family protein n=1 Tax=Methylomonas sp. TaxID=418 RepID=UPI0025DAE702|nr:flotillin family protein [Methylomonas sp.]MCK9605754.1 flotillin family protein [Methylomonas sp.]